MLEERLLKVDLGWWLSQSGLSPECVGVHVLSAGVDWWLGQGESLEPRMLEQRQELGRW